MIQKERAKLLTEIDDCAEYLYNVAYQYEELQMMCHKAEGQDTEPQLLRLVASIGDMLKRAMRDTGDWMESILDVIVKKD